MRNTLISYLRRVPIAPQSTPESLTASIACIFQSRPVAVRHESPLAPPIQRLRGDRKPPHRRPIPPGHVPVTFDPSFRRVLSRLRKDPALASLFAPQAAISATRGSTGCPRAVAFFSTLPNRYALTLGGDTSATPRNTRRTGTSRPPARGPCRRGRAPRRERASSTAAVSAASLWKSPVKETEAASNGKGRHWVRELRANLVLNVDGPPTFTC